MHADSRRAGGARFHLLLALAASACSALLGCQQTFPVKETNPVKIPTVCLAPKLPLATIQPGAGDRFPSAQCIERAQSLVGQMTPAEKFGQMLQPDRGTIRNPADLGQFGIGSLLSGGGSAPVGNTQLAWARMLNDFREQSLKSRLQIPLIYGVDAVHGHNNVKDAVIFPHNIGLGATRDADLVQRIGRATAEEVAATNVDWDFAPVLAGARDERWGRTYEAFGESAELATLLGPAYIKGLQGERLGRGPASVLATAKHFIADGNTTDGKDQGDAHLTPEQVHSELIPAYRASVEAGVGSVMASYSSIDGIKMHCNGPLLHDTLKSELGFAGFVVSDWQAIEKLPGQFGTQLAHAINAGVDMVMAPNANTATITTLATVVPDAIPMARIDDAVTRILTVKCELGLLDPQRWQQRDRSGQLPMNAELMGKFGGAEHRALAREAVQKSLVLLKNEGNLLPLPKATVRVALAGKSADDIGRQCGGWTITWQGQEGPITQGTTIRAGLEAALAGVGRVSFAVDGVGLPSADVAIAVVGERPYAEYNGDKADLRLDPEDLQLVRALKQQGMKVVLMVISGRPLILGEAGELADAIVAAWLPGSEGAGVADVLLGDVGFSGKLSHSWPRSMAQIPINVGDPNYDPLYAYGFGLTTQSHPPVAPAP